MQTVSQFLSADHRRCDELFANAEEAAQKNEWTACERGFHSFLTAMEHHFQMEEKILFPQLDEITGQGMGPVQVMRIEHEQIRELFEQMEDAVKQQDSDDYLGAAETLLTFMQQHNMKEEQILYAMADSMFGNAGHAVVQHMEKINND